MATRLEEVNSQIATLEAQLASLLADLSDPQKSAQLVDIRTGEGHGGAVASYSQRIKLVQDRLKALYEERQVVISRMPILETHEIAMGYSEIGRDKGEYISG